MTESETPMSDTSGEAELPPLPEAISPERQKELEKILEEQYRDGVEMEEGEDDDFDLLKPL